MKRFQKKRLRVTSFVVLLLLLSSYVAFRVMLDPHFVDQKAQRVLSELFGVQVEVHGSSFHPFTGLAIGEVIIPVQHEGRRQVLAELHDIHVNHYLASLFTGRLTISEIRAGSLAVNFARAADGSWNLAPVLATLRSRPLTRSLLPSFRVNDLRLAYHDELTLDRQGRPFDVELRGMLAAVDPRPGQRVLELTLAVDDPDLGSWQVREASLDVDAGELKLTAESNRLPINESLNARLGARGREILNAYGPPAGGDVQFLLHLDYRWAAAKPLDFRLEADVQGTAVTSVHFPYRLEDVKGLVVLTPEGVHVDHVTAVSGSASFSFTGDFQGYSSDAGVDLSVAAERVRADKKLRTAFSEARRAVFDSFAPSGMIDFHARIARQPGPDRSTSVSIEARNSRTGSEPLLVTYVPFPYPLTLTGSATYTDGHVRIDPAKPVLAVHGDNTFSISGSIDPGEPRSLVDLTFRGAGINLEPDLYRALPSENQRLWDYLQPVGKVAATVLVKRDQPSADLTDLDVTLTDLDALFTCRDFPYPIQAGTGSISYRRTALPEPTQTLVLDNLVGRHDKTEVVVNGKLSGLGREKSSPTVDLTISARKLPLNDDLKKAVPASVAWMWDVLHPDPAGLVDARCTFKRDDPSLQGLEYRIQLRALDVALLPDLFPYKLNHLVGQVDFFQPLTGPDAGVGLLTLTRLRGVGDSGARVEVNGSLKGLEKGKTPGLVDLSVSATYVPLDADLRAALSPAYGGTFDALSPTGKVDVFAHLERNTTLGDSLNPRIVVTARGNQIRYEKVPLSLTDVTGQIEILPGQIRLSGLSGKALGGRVTLDGVIKSPADHAVYDLDVHAHDITLDDKLLQVLPEKYRPLVARLDPTGRADVALALAREWVSPSESRVHYKASLGLREASLAVDPPNTSPDRDQSQPRRLTNIEGVVDVTGVTGVDDLHGRLNLSTVQFGKISISDVMLRVDRYPDRWELYDLDAGLYGGHVTGQIQIRRTSWSGFGAVLSLDELDIARVGAELFNMRPGQVAGKLSGKIELQGTHLAMKDLVGKADLSVSQGKLWELPVVLAMLNVLNIPPMDRTAFTDARAALQLYDSRFHIKRIDLLGNTVSIYGTGEIAAAGDMKLTFLTGISRLGVPDIPIVADIIKAAQKQLMLIKVSGTVRDPKLEVEPVFTITGAVKALIADIFGPSDALTVSKLKEAPPRD